MALYCYSDFKQKSFLKCFIFGGYYEFKMPRARIVKETGYVWYMAGIYFNPIWKRFIGYFILKRKWKKING